MIEKNWLLKVIIFIFLQNIYIIRHIALLFDSINKKLPLNFMKLYE
jgi:hypothetical protein